VAVRLLDTNIVSYLAKAHPLAAVYQPHLAGYDHAVSFQTVAELLAGAAWARWGAAKRAALTATLAGMTVLESSPAVCQRWADVWVVRRSRPIGVADAWIAATALAHGLELVTHNPADFAGIPGLTVITEAP
jgi:hypothetical protein